MLSHVAHIFRVSKIQLLVYVICSLLIIILNTRFVVTRIAEVNEASREALPMLRESYNQFSAFLGRQEAVSRVALVLFWCTVGALVYVLMWIAGGVLKEVKNTVVEELYYTKPNHEAMVRGKMFLVGSVLLHLSVIFMIFFMTIVFMQLILPFATRSVRGFMANFPNQTAIFNSLLGLLAVIVSMHILVVLFRALVMKIEVPQK